MLRMAAEELVLYRKLARAARANLAACHRHDWPAVEHCREEVDGYTVQLQAAPAALLSPRQNQCKSTLIRYVLAAEKQSAALMQARMAVLATSINAITSGDKIENIYGSKSTKPAEPNR
jgi:Flagellar protein FliT